MQTRVPPSFLGMRTTGAANGESLSSIISLTTIFANSSFSTARLAGESRYGVVATGRWFPIFIRCEMLVGRFQRKRFCMIAVAHLVDVVHLLSCPLLRRYVLR